MGALTARTQRDVEIDRAIAVRCPRCGSRRTDAGGAIEVDGEVKPVGVECFACGYLRDAIGTIRQRVYHAPGTDGSHDVEADYRKVGES